MTEKAIQKIEQKQAAPLVLRVGGNEIKANGEAQAIMLRKTNGSWTADEVATLGESDVFVRRDAQGLARLFRAKVKLSSALKEIQNIGYADNPTWIITVPGYTKLNQVAGIHLITPPSIMDAGVEHANPYVQYVDGEIKRVIARKIALGYSPSGNLVAIDCTRHYNFDAYYMQDLQAKSKKEGAAKLGTQYMCPFSPDTAVDNDGKNFYCKVPGKVYVFKPIKDMEGFWIDPAHPEIFDVYKQHIQHQKFGDTIAQSLAARNALKAHPGIAATQVRPSKEGISEISVFAWRHGMSNDQIQQIGEKIVKGEQLADVQVQQDTAEATFEEVQEGATTEVDESVPADAAPGGEGGLFDQKGAPTQDEPKNIMAEIEKMAKEKGIDLIKFCKNLCDSRPENLTPDQQKKLFTVISHTEGAATRMPKEQKEAKP